MASQAVLDSKYRDFIVKALGSDGFEVLALAGDASSRRYYRIVHGDQTHVLMVWDPFVDDGKFPFLNVLAHFKKHGVHAPKVVAKDPALGVIFLEDLGDLTLERKFWENQKQDLALPYYKKAIDEIIKVHYPASDDSSSPCVAFGVAFDTKKLMWEMNYGREHLFEKLVKIKLSDAVRSELENEFTDICTTLDKEPKRICHRDYHSRNLMLKLGKVYMIDFQDARMGPVQYDLVSLVYDSYVNLEEAIRNDILDYYLQQAKQFLQQPLDRNHFFQIMRVQVLQRCFKACGSFSSFFNTREDLRYLKYIAPTMAQVLDALDAFPKYKVFRGLILDNGLHTRDYENPEVNS